MATTIEQNIIVLRRVSSLMGVPPDAFKVVHYNLEAPFGEFEELSSTVHNEFVKPCVSWPLMVCRNDVFLEAYDKMTGGNVSATKRPSPVITQLLLGQVRLNWIK